MNSNWLVAIVAAIGFAGNFCWTLVNLRIENKLLKHVDGLKEWVDDRYVRKPDAPAHARKLTA